MTKHTQEPWTMTPHHPGVAPAAIHSEAENVVITGLTWARAVSDANARRIVACVNACAGIPTEALERGGIALLLAEAAELLKNTEYGDGIATGLTQDHEALENASAKLRGEG